MPRTFTSRLWVFGALLFAFNAGAIAVEQPLEADQAFEMSADLKDSNTVRLSWDIADGYYLYRQKFKFVSFSPTFKINQPVFPAGQTKQDKSFGAVAVYRDRLELELPIQILETKPATLSLEVTFQGCADAGFCYMPITKIMTLDLSD